MQPGESKRNEQRRNFYLRYAGIGLEFAGGVAGFTLLGWLVDRWLGWQPYGLVTGAVLGFVGGMYNLIRRAFEIQAGVARMRREDDEATKRRESDDFGHGTP